jgi:two-component system chemotaxis response regulator CheB
MALRALEEKSALSRRMAEDRFRSASRTGRRFQTMAEDAETAGATLRRLIAELGSTSTQERDTAAPADRPDDLPGRLR